MSRIKIVTFEDSTNLVKNSSFEAPFYPSVISGNELYGWSEGSSTYFYEEKSDVRFGAASLRIYASGIANTTGGAYQSVTLLASGQQYTLSGYVKTLVGSGVIIANDDSIRTRQLFNVPIVNSSNWQYFSKTFTAPAGVQLFFNPSSNGQMLLDGIQLEKKAYATTYFDGSFTGAYFQGTNHQSASIRQYENGGRVVDLEDFTGTKLQKTVGFGMAEPINNISQYALVDGAYLSSITYQPRDLAIGVLLIDNDIDDLQDLREDLINAFKSRRIPSNQPVRLQYTSNDGTIKEIKAFYRSGFNAPNMGGNIHEKVVIDLVATNPMFYSLYDEAESLGANVTLSGVNNGIVITPTGSVAKLPAISNGAIYTIAFADANPDVLFAGGTFNSAGGVAGTRNIFKYTISTGVVEPLASGVSNSVYSIYADSDTMVYAGGAFTYEMVASGALYRIGQWDGNSNRWNQLGNNPTGAGVNSTVRAVIRDNYGTLYIGGEFDRSGLGGVGATVLNGLAKYNNTTGYWDVLASGQGLSWSANQGVYALAVGLDNTVYIGGKFTSSVTGAENIAKIDYGTITISAMSKGLNDSVRALYTRKDGKLVIGGDFTAENTTGLALKRAAIWNGSTYSQVSNGIDNLTARAIDSGDNNVTVIAGDFTSANGSTAISRLARFTSNTLLPYPISLPGSGAISAYTYNSQGYKALAVLSSGIVTSAKQTTVSVGGNTETYARFRITFPGVLRYIRNETTGQEINFNYTLQSGEIIDISLEPGNIYARNNFGNDIKGRLFLTNKDVAPFTLIPGDNVITTFMSGSTTTASDIRLIWKNAYLNGD